MDNRFQLSGSDIESNHGKRFRELPDNAQEAILSYGLVVEELVGYAREDIVDVFVRLNKYGVRLLPQEFRHALGTGVFEDAIETVGAWSFWLDERVVTPAKNARMRTDELAAELIILLAEGGPQDKKDVVNQYYIGYAEDFPDRTTLTQLLRQYFNWFSSALEGDQKSRFRKPVDFYGLIGAIDRVSEQGKRLKDVPPATSGNTLLRTLRPNSRLRPPHPAPADISRPPRGKRTTSRLGQGIDTLAELLQGAK